jgi:hypothetical protein
MALPKYPLRLAFVGSELHINIKLPVHNVNSTLFVGPIMYAPENRLIVVIVRRDENVSEEDIASIFRM